MTRTQIHKKAHSLKSYFEKEEIFSDPIITRDAVLFVAKDYIVQQHVPSFWQLLFRSPFWEIDFVFRDGAHWVITFVLNEEGLVQLKGPYDLATGQLIGDGPSRHVGSISDLLLATYLGYFPDSWSEKVLSLRQQLESILKRSLKGDSLVSCGKRMACVATALRSVV